MLYTPPHFKVAERDHALELMRRHPLATLVSMHADDDEAAVSHLPLSTEQRDDTIILHGHLARANFHWQKWTDGTRLLAIFHGPDAYVSPFVYQTRESVPTWNYAVVHAAGRVTLRHDSASKESVLKRLIDEHDVPYRQRWDELDVDFRERMKEAIVAFEVVVDRLDVKFKLSQNRPAADRAGVVDAMRAAGAGGAEIAALMQATAR